MYSASPKQSELFSTMNKVEARMIEKLDAQYDTVGQSKLAFTVKGEAAMMKFMAPYLARSTATHF